MHSQGEQIDTIDNHITYGHMAIDNGKESLVEANKYFFRYTPILVGSALGALAMGPLGVDLHLKFGGLLALGGGFFGGLAGYKIQKV